ncbi:hypothetical protein [Cohnella abietis]|uniref:Uncharacterized protein n=1 Tax=Cohnella abietis TaxID=2507935 RepID=A0A3T1D3J7_9BACL|nr:hypothetical protein [Cohnella abietis]BBI32690.1 hypothetical protein KCTCHS21_20890 [Cohnella abietis]
MHDQNHLNHSRSLNDALSQLVKSIAIEEEALATLMRAEADKTLAFVGKERDLPTQPSTSEFIQFNQTVTQILDSILMAEWIMMKKIDTVMQFQQLAQPSNLKNTSNKSVDSQGPYDSSFENKYNANHYNELDDIDY